MGKSTDDDVYKTEYRWRAINHKHTIFNERIFDNDFTRANIVGTIRRKRINGSQDIVMLLGQLLTEFKTLKEELVSIETESTNNINSLCQELENLQLQLTNLQKESKNQTFLQEQYQEQLENLKKSLESMC